MTLKTFALTFGTLLAGSSAALAVPITATLQFQVSAAVIGSGTVTSTDSKTWVNPNDPLAVNAFAAASDDSGNHAQVDANGNATWATDGNSGTIFMHYGWEGVGATALHSNNLLPNWTYNFTADATGTFTMNYNIVGSGDTFGLWGFHLDNNFDASSGAPTTDAFNPSSSGLFTGSVTGGNTYTISLSNNGNVELNGGFTQPPGAVDGTFGWSIAANTQSAPDGGEAIALLGMGIAGLAALRRKLR